MSREERREMGLKGRQHVMDNYNFDNFNKRMDRDWETTCDSLNLSS